MLALAALAAALVLLESAPPSQGGVRLAVVVPAGGQIMAYDQHAPGTAAGPVAGFPWVQQIVAYARSVVPPAD